MNEKKDIELESDVQVGISSTACINCIFATYEENVQNGWHDVKVNTHRVHPGSCRGGFRHQFLNANPYSRHS